MATFLDIGLLEYFLPVFSFILILVLLYAILQKTKLLGGKSGIDFAVSVFITLIATLSGRTIDFINVSIPWFVLLVVAIVLIFIVTSIGLKGEILDIPYLKNVVLFVSLIIILASLNFVFGPFNAANYPIIETILHPRILGAILMVLIIAGIVKVVVKNS